MNTTQNYYKMEFKNQLDLFRHVWLTREHVSELSGKFLLPPSHPQWHFQFLHLLGKGTYTKYKLREENIILALPEEHAIQERYPIFIERQNAVRRDYLKEFEGKEFDED